MLRTDTLCSYPLFGISADRGRSKKPQRLPNRWKRAGKIFTITLQGRDLDSAYALNIAEQPLPLMKKIVELFGEAKTPWSLAVWFGPLTTIWVIKKPKTS